jgi:leucine dehydrogenase
MKITEIPVQGWEKVVRAEDPASGLKAMIAIHDTTLGPALGGLRMWPYAGDDEGLTDVLRLSRGMTYKSAVARTGLGGGKSILFGDSRTQKTEALFRAMGRFVDSLGGKYITAEDVGTSVHDMNWIRKETKWVTGRERSDGGSGDPSPFTAYGTFLGVRAFVEEALGRRDLKGLRVGIQGAKVTVCDVNEDKASAVARELGAAKCSPDAIFDLDAEVYAPCALGATLNDRTIPRLKCKVIAGAANNQLHEPRHADALKARGIAYAPDYVINAGGIINVGDEFGPGGYDEIRATKKVEGIYDTLKRILTISRETGVTTAVAADRLAEEILAAGR